MFSELYIVLRYSIKYIFIQKSKNIKKTIVINIVKIKFKNKIN